jgi:hypothetical protein
LFSVGSKSEKTSWRPSGDGTTSFGCRPAWVRTCLGALPSIGTSQKPDVEIVRAGAGGAGHVGPVVGSGVEGRITPGRVVVVVDAGPDVVVLVVDGAGGRLCPPTPAGSEVVAVVDAFPSGDAVGSFGASTGPDVSPIADPAGSPLRVPARTATEPASPFPATTTATPPMARPPATAKADQRRPGRTRRGAVMSSRGSAFTPVPSRKAALASLSFTYRPLRHRHEERACSRDRFVAFVPRAERVMGRPGHLREAAERTGCGGG